MGTRRRYLLASVALRRALLLGLFGALATSISTVNALASTDLGASSFSLVVGALSGDADVAVTPGGIALVATDAAAIGQSAPGVEMTSAKPAVRSALTAGHYAYTFTVGEVSADTLGVGEDLRIEVYGDNALLATLYAQQATAEGLSAEGVSVTVDLGSPSAVPDTIDIIVKRQ